MAETVGANSYQVYEEAMVWNISSSYVTLNSPTNNYISTTNSVDFNCTATAVGGASVTNMSLWTNASGTWQPDLPSNYITTYRMDDNFDDSSISSNWTTAITGAGWSITEDTEFLKLTASNSAGNARVTSGNSTGGTIQYYNETNGYYNVTAKIVMDMSWNFGSSVSANNEFGLTDGTNYVRFKNITRAGTIVSAGDLSNYNLIINRQTQIGQLYNDGVLENASIDLSSLTKGYYFYAYNEFSGFSSTPDVAISIYYINSTFTHFDQLNQTKSITEPTLWTCQACDSDGDCGFASENRTVLVDTAQPSIDIVRPAVLEDIGYTSGTQNLSWIITDSNFNSAWYNYNGTNISLNGATNSTTFQLDGSDRSLTLWANDTAGNVNSTTRTWAYTVFVNTNTYNTTTYETASETFEVNATGATSVNLIYNGTSYAATQSGDIWSKTIDIPEVTTPANKSFYWSFNTGTGITNSTTYNQSVLNANFSICGGEGGTTPFLNFTFKDETTGAVLNASNDLTSVTYWLGSGATGYTKSYTFQNTSVNYEYDFCAVPNVTFNVDMSFKYSNEPATSYPLRTFTYDNQALTNTTTHKTLYLLSIVSGAQYVAIRTTTTAGNGISGVTITYERQISGVWTLIGQEVTGDDGVATFWVDPNYQYRFIASKTGYTTASVTVQPSQAQYTLIMSTGTGETFASSSQGLRWAVHPASGPLNPGLKEFNATITSAYGDLENCKFDLLNATNSSQNLTTITGITNSTYCFLQVNYIVVKNSKYFGRLSVDTTNSSGFFIIDSDWYWLGADLNNTQGWSKLSSFFQDIKSISEFGEGNEGEFSRLVLFFLIMTMIIGVFTFFSGVELSNPGASIILVWGVILLASVGNFFTYAAGTHLTEEGSVSFIAQYGLFLCFTILTAGYVLSLFRRTGE